MSAPHPFEDNGTRQGAIPVLSHPDYDRRLRSCTESADPRQPGEALAGFSQKTVTAGGDFHPALRT
ncbi:hypothetical protein SAMN05428936_1178 [Pelagibacterium halotolerans]|nr:hypothetical protein SAMN05428936_1178 [Pelagibacterium halotolerans]